MWFGWQVVYEAFSTVVNLIVYNLEIELFSALLLYIIIQYIWAWLDNYNDGWF